MHRKHNLITVGKLAAIAILAGLFIAGGVVGYVASANAATVKAKPPIIQLVDWPHAFALMADHHEWCALDDQPGLLACTPAQWPGHTLVRVGSFRDAMRDLRAGAAITREQPHVWLAAPRWFG